MNSNAIYNNRELNTNRFNLSGSKEEMALNMEVIRTRESRRNKIAHQQFPV